MKQFLSRPAAILVAAVCLGLVALGPARAQTEYSEAQLESFVDAAVVVNDLIQAWRPRIEAADSEQEAAQLREQANQELAQAIEATEGMSLEEYQMIGQAAQADPELSERINDIYQARLELEQ